VVGASDSDLVLRVRRGGRERGGPAACPRCGGRDLTQDADILDTWFSSALWPIATLGWPRETQDLAYFYPTSALVTARDIIFLWVARMIMFGLEFRDEVPFRNVYINPTVLNIEGKRMSKSLGTGIDPLELVDRYGADSLRFALINRCTGEQDLRFSEKMVEDTRNFANKIWNAARFVRIGLAEGHGGAPGPGPATATTLPGRWILSRFGRAARAVTEALEGFEFRDACQNLYAFIWSEFCDWYVEMIKVDLRAGGPAAEETRQVAAWVLSQTMCLLHPIMPSLTEEIWQALPHAGETIMRAPWPVPEERGPRDRWAAACLDEAAEREMDEVMGLVRAIRGMRADLGVPAGEARPVGVIYPAGAAPLASALQPYVAALARASRLDVASADAQAARPAGVSMLWGAAEVVIPVESEDARAAAGQRLRKQRADVERDLRGLRARLQSAAFLERAPVEVVDADRARERDLAARRDTLARYLEGLEAAPP